MVIFYVRLSSHGKD